MGICLALTKWTNFIWKYCNEQGTDDADDDDDVDGGGAGGDTRWLLILCKRARAGKISIQKNVFDENGTWCVAQFPGPVSPLRNAMKSKQKHVRRIADNEHKQSAYSWIK